MDLSNFREEYLKGQLHRKDLAENPFEHSKPGLNRP